MAFENFHLVKYQYLASIFANIVLFAQGLNIGWLSPALPLLMSNDSPLEGGPISADMAGSIGSFLCIGALSGCLILSFLSNYIGHKKAILLCGIPITISGLFIIFGTTAWHLCLSRFFCGIGFGGTMVVYPQFVAEIASDFIRGELNSYMQISTFLGVLCGFIGGSYIPYETYPLIMIMFPLVFLCSFSFMPDSPQFLLGKFKVDLAEESLRFYRNCRKGNSDYEKKLQDEFEKFIAIAKQRESAENLQFSEFGTPSVLRALLISPFLSLVCALSGSFAIINYAVIVFEQTGSTIDPKVSAIVMGIIQVLGTYTASQLIDRLGRKTLLLISMCGGLVTCTVTGTFTYLGKQGFDISSLSILPVISISAYVFLYAIGLLPVPYVMVAEVLPQRIRRVGATFYTCIVLVLAILMLKWFPVMLYTLEVHGCMLLFACVITIGILFTIFVVRETKGINLDTLELNDKITITN